jgi:hypothetical protein
MKADLVCVAVTCLIHRRLPSLKKLRADSFVEEMNSLLLIAVCLSILLANVHADSFDKICDKHLSDAMSNISGEKCCNQWLVTWCSLEALPDIVRGASAAGARALFEAGECSKYAGNVSGSMPLACYWTFRKWAVIMIGAVAIMAIIIPTLVVFAVRRRRRQASMRMF